MKIKEPIQVWDSCLATIQKKVNDQSFKTWFQPIKAVALKDNILTIQVPSKIFYEWLEEHYVGVLKQAIKAELGIHGMLEYQILVDRRVQTKKEFAPAKELDIEREYAYRQIKNPFIIPGIKKEPLASNLSDQYTFQNFIEGDCNRLARGAGVAIANKPGKTAFNPLVIFGDVGLGKTHLGQAIGNEILKTDQTKRVVYVTSEKFTNQIIQAIKQNSVDDFVNFYQSLDVLIVDDIQFLANRVKTQEIFFHVFNQLHQNRKQIILTSDKPPKDLQGMEERMISRFKWGLSADLHMPDLETRIAIIESKMQEEGIEIPGQIIEFICYNVDNNIRELEGVLVSLIAQSSLNEREVDMNLAKEVIEKFISRKKKEISIDNIRDLVADHFNISYEKIAGKTRKRNVVMARQLSMYLAKNYTDQPLKAIGQKFGGRDHSTVIYSIRAVQDLLDTDDSFKVSVIELEKKIKMSLLF